MYCENLKRHLSRLSVRGKCNKNDDFKQAFRVPAYVRGSINLFLCRSYRRLVGEAWGMLPTPQKNIGSTSPP